MKYLAIILAGLVTSGCVLGPSVTLSDTPTPNMATETVEVAEVVIPTAEVTRSVEPSATAESKEVVIVATGDVMLGRAVNVVMLEEGYTWPFEQTRELLTGGDITLINLESPFIDPCPKRYGGMTFCAPKEAVEGLVYAGVDVANIANNHILDYGYMGSSEYTAKILEEAGIKWSNEDHLAIVEREGLKFGFLGINLIRQSEAMTILSEEEMGRRIALADLEVDVLVVSYHFGEEYENFVNDYQRFLAYMAVDMGADLVIGTHPHVTLPVEVYKEKVIAYSLGNFVFDQMWSEETMLGQVGKFVFLDGVLIRHEMIDVRIYDYGQPRVISLDE